MKLRFLLVALGAVLLIALVAVLLPRLRGPNQRTLVASVEGARHLSTNDVAMPFRFSRSSTRTNADFAPGRLRR
jgi:hypothetical protein